MTYLEIYLPVVLAPTSVASNTKVPGYLVLGYLRLALERYSTGKWEASRRRVFNRKEGSIRMASAILDYKAFKCRPRWDRSGVGNLVDMCEQVNEFVDMLISKCLELCTILVILALALSRVCDG